MITLNDPIWGKCRNFWLSDEMCWKEEETAKEKEEVERDHPQVVWQPPVTTGHKK